MGTLPEVSKPGGVVVSGMPLSNTPVVWADGSTFARGSGSVVGVGEGGSELVHPNEMATRSQPQDRADVR